MTENENRRPDDDLPFIPTMTSPETETSLVLEARGISKGFPGIQALSDVQFGVRPGEVHALVGENGAGKSTLMQILAGVYRPDSGEILVDGRSVVFDSRQDAERAGISIVFQELSLVPQLSIAENIFAGRQPTRRFGIIDRKAMEREAAAALAPFGLTVPPSREVRTLSLASQQIVEIAKALSVRAKILILDEPTSSLTPLEIQRLHALIGDLRSQGLGIVYISHHLREVFAIADRITVLRDGQYQGTWDTSAVTEQQIINAMVGRAMHAIAGGYRPRAFGDEIALRATELTRHGEFSDVSFDLHRGEILGLAGLVGAGRSELAQALFGLTRLDRGTLELDGKPIHFSSPEDAVRSGLGYLTEDRKQAGLFLAMSLASNIMAPSLEQFSRHGLIDDQLARTVSADYMERLHIRARSVEQKVVGLSGGNQQKVLLAMWLATDPRILIIDEPTRGVDVGAKAEIHQLLLELADQGVSIFLISSELPEVLHLSDTVLVMHRGRITARFAGGEVDEDTVLTYAAGLGAPQTSDESLKSEGTVA